MEKNKILGNVCFEEIMTDPSDLFVLPVLHVLEWGGLVLYVDTHIYEGMGVGR